MIGLDYSFPGKRPIFCGAKLLLVLGSGNGQIVTDCMCFPQESKYVLRRDYPYIPILRMGLTGVIETNWLYTKMTKETFFLNSQKWKKTNWPQKKETWSHFLRSGKRLEIFHTVSLAPTKKPPGGFGCVMKGAPGILWTRRSVCRRLRSYVLGLSSSVVGLKAKVNLFYFTWRIITHCSISHCFPRLYTSFRWLAMEFLNHQQCLISTGGSPTPISKPRKVSWVKGHLEGE